MTRRRKTAVRHEPTVKELFEDRRAIDAALREAARDARRLHKALGNPMATWKDGQVVWVQPEDIQVEDEGHDSRARRIMKLDPDEKELLESVERGEWKSAGAGEVARMGERVRQRLRADVQAGFDALARGEGRSHDKLTGRRLAASIKSRGRAKRTKQR